MNGNIMVRVRSGKNKFIGLTKLKNMFLGYFKIFHFSLTVLTLSYLIMLFSVDRLFIKLDIASEECREYLITGDVVNTVNFSSYKNIYPLNDASSNIISFPLKSKVFTINLCPNKDLTIKSLEIVSKGNKNIDMLLADYTCYFCEMRKTDSGIYIKALTENSKFDVLEYIKILPTNIRIVHYLLRYLPYLILFLFLMLYIIPMIIESRLLLSVFALSSLTYIVILLAFNKIRKLMPPSEINSEWGINLSQYKGISVTADTLLLYIMLLTPFVFYIIIRIIFKTKRIK